MRIVVGGILTDMYAQRFIMRINDGDNSLIISNASLADSGTYTCTEKFGFGAKATADLIVLGMDIV